MNFILHIYVPTNLVQNVNIPSIEMGVSANNAINVNELWIEYDNLIPALKVVSGIFPY